MNDAPGAELDLARARLLVEMAEIALGDLSGDVFLPDGWDLLQLVRADGGAAPRARGFYAAGRLGGAGSPRVAVLALALPWQQYLDWTMNAGGKVELAAPPAGVAAGAPADARFDAMLGKVYALMRGPVWQHLAQALAEGRGTLWITAKNLAGPLAHLAALDLRPGNPGPKGEPAPATAPTCLTFSTAPAGNAALKTFADATGGAVTNVWAGTEAIPVDFFPTAPAAAQGYALPGTLERVSAPIPALDDPWTERGGPLYLRALKGTPEGIATPGAVKDPPAGFRQTLAHTLAKLSLVAYQRRQHPERTILDVAPFALTHELSSGGVPWCALFESPTDVVAAFRGTVTADELMRITAESSVASPGFLPGRGRVHAGVLRLYAGPSAAGGDAPSFRVALAQWLQAKAAGRPISLTGHDVGGALAALAALDLRTTAPDLRVEKVYTFGDTPLGDYDFGVQYAARLAADSYRLARDGDFARRLQLMSAYEPLPRTVLVTGAPADDDASRHSLASYITLLDSARQSSLEVSAVLEDTGPAPAAAVGSALTPEERAWMDAKLAGLGVIARPPRLGRPLAAGPDGRIVLSTTGESALPPLVPEGGGAPVFAVDALHVAAGDTLVVRADDGVAPRLVAARLALGEGARVSLPAGSEVHAARTESAEGTQFRLVANDGMAGLSGAPGPPGRTISLNEKYHPDGGPGDPGVHGEDGGRGGGALYLGSVTGTVTVIAGGGNGAPGGAGGRGGDGFKGIGGAYGPGNGADGGEGGRGGSGGPGGTVVLEVALEPGGAVNLIALRSTGAPGGTGGGRGLGGILPGSRSGKDGKPGEDGNDGTPGDIPVFSLRRHDG